MPKAKSTSISESNSSSGSKMVVATKVAKRTVQTTLSFAAKTASATSSELPSELIALQSAELDALERDTMGPSWNDALQSEFGKAYFVKLKEFISNEIQSETVYPPLKDVYSWSRLTPLDSVKIVILGQDPYHNVGQAHGLSFSVLPPTALPGSLKNIYKQMKEDVEGFIVPKTGDLTPLAQLGVLWLNTSLTVRAHKAGSHSGKGWEKFTEQVVRSVLSRKTDNGNKGVVFMAWGLPAQKTCDRIGIDETKHLILRSPHPSPLSAHRGFLGNGHFRKANEWLRERYGEGAEIDWGVIGGN